VAAWSDSGWRSLSHVPMVEASLAGSRSGPMNPFQKGLLSQDTNDSFPKILFAFDCYANLLL
jgi:hypothetical protein